MKISFLLEPHRPLLAQLDPPPCVYYYDLSSGNASNLLLKKRPPILEHWKELLSPSVTEPQRSWLVTPRLAILLG
ncbi:hypothetical protein TNIN_230531 [Trichonephila inaurata madagascariensis]|uniref:Uncharacterized protein n=1 Tax=Trichonephila inaurata madagascariensis TaxID=2747483 RepID=A0A8X6XZK4_9ARAC|nr:hypothetical protein TNIN_230531 [Trichonephila inaurata madagascariensis]